MSTYTPDSLAGWDVGLRARRTRPVPVHPRHPPDDVSRPAVDDAPVRRDSAPPPNPTAATGICSRHGVNGLSVAFDLPTQMGYDSDHPLAAGEVGRVGVAIDSIEDMAALFDGIPLDRVSTSMTINATAIILLALYIAVARRQGVADALTLVRHRSRTTSSRSTSRAAPISTRRVPRFASSPTSFAFCERELPNWNTISISGYHIREAGSTAVQEVAFTFAHAIAYVQAAIDAGPRRQRVRPARSRSSSTRTTTSSKKSPSSGPRGVCGRRIMRDRFGATNPRAQQLRFHTQTAGSTLTAQQPDNNIVRVALQALAAVLGGTQSLHCNGRDEALALPTEEVGAASRCARSRSSPPRAGVTNTVDPVARLLRDRNAHQRDRARGRRAARSHRAAGRHAGRDRSRVHPARDPGIGLSQRSVAIDSGESVVVGVNKFVGLGRPDRSAAVPSRSGSANAARSSDSGHVRAGRSASAWSAALEASSRTRRRRAATSCRRSSRAVEAQATVGEISDAMRAVFGVYQETATL